MTEENFSSEAKEPTLSRIRLRVAAEADPAALPRIVSLLHTLSLLPRRLIAEQGSGELLHVQIDFVGVSEERISLVTGKVAQGVHVLNAFWHYL
jgi:hypothetical protein